jgi:hypothetical protein
MQDSRIIHIFSNDYTRENVPSKEEIIQTKKELSDRFFVQSMYYSYDWINKDHVMYGIPNPTEAERGRLEISEDKWEIFHHGHKHASVPPWVFQFIIGTPYAKNAKIRITHGYIDTRMSGWSIPICSINLMTKTAKNGKGKLIRYRDGITILEEKIKNNPDYEVNLGRFYERLEERETGEIEIPIDIAFYLKYNYNRVTI